MGVLTRLRQLSNYPTHIALPAPVPQGAADEEYHQLLQRAKVRLTPPRPSQQDALLAFLREAAIPVYNADRVHRYMSWTAAGKRQNWCWRRLTGESSITPTWSHDWTPFDSLFHGRMDGYYLGVRQASYQHPIPKAVLRTIVAIQEGYALAPEVAFFVSDYEAPKPDPFLAVGHDHAEMLVVDYWHEPGFTP